MRKSVAALSAAVLCAALLAACGSSDSGSSTKTVTVPAGKLGSSSLIHEGSYMGRTEDGRSVKFSYSIDNAVTNFKVDGKLIAAKIPMNEVGVGFTYSNHGSKYTGNWQTTTSVTGTITGKNSQGKVVETDYEVNAFAS